MSSEASAKGNASSSATTRKRMASRNRAAVESTSMMLSTPVSPRIRRDTKTVVGADVRRQGEAAPDDCQPLCEVVGNAR